MKQTIDWYVKLTFSTKFQQEFNTISSCFFISLQLSLMWNIGYYTSPLIITFLYRRGYFVAESITSFAKVSTGIGLLVVISLCMRGFGRSSSPIYRNFVKALEDAKANTTSQSLKDKLRMYDFEFKDWPVDFNVKDVSGWDKRNRYILN